MRLLTRRRPALLFLDIDGVLAPLGRGGDPSLRLLQWSGWNPSIRYDPEVLAFLSALRATGLCEIEWLTSWQDEANPCFARVGFGPFKTHFQQDAYDDIWWKSKVVERALLRHPTRAIAWIDDELTTHVHGGYETMTWTPATYGARLLALCPDPAQGLKSGYLKELLSFLRRSASAS